ncbi:MAG TPA: putative sugar O-methyltransferase [Solirubrobacteraceae bacterium]|nr:putative sugar O-methyltransferase [Solirubrobacteraceae bacterium]
MSTLRQRVAATVNRGLALADLQLVRRHRFQDALARIRELPTPAEDPGAVEAVGEPRDAGLPSGDALARAPDQQPSPEVREALRSDHPRLGELRRRYARHPAAARSVWSDETLARELALPWFRRDNPFMWQSRDYGYWDDAGVWVPAATREVNYVLSAYYVRSVDRLGLLDRLSDDADFGAVSVPIADGWSVTRDLLDSVLEINFLDRHLNLGSRDGLEMLDIGAGYGRLAYRLTEAFSNISRILCTDAVPESTFLSEFYLAARGTGQRTEVVALDEVAGRLQNASVTVAINVHSFPECPLETIAWWLELVVANSIPYLFIACNTTRLHSTEPDGSMLDFEPLLRSHGYELLALEPKYRLSPRVQQHGIFPAQYHLYRRRT